MSLLGKTVLLPATFRGVPFAVVDQTTSAGRRVAVHEYWGQDKVWSEDLGRGATRYKLRGFILDSDQLYAGGPIEEQRLLLLAAGKASGPGVLTHPALGLLTVVCENVSLSEQLDGASVSWVDFSFIEAGQQGFPSLSLDAITGAGEVITAAALAAGYVNIIGLDDKGAPGAADGSLAAVSGQWSDTVVSAGADATALSRLVATLPGNFGRYSRGAVAPDVVIAAETMPDLVKKAVDRREVIAAAAADVADTTAGLTVSSTEADYAKAVAALIASLSAACADPADAIRLLSQLLAFTPIGLEAATAAGQAVSGTFELSATIELARVSTRYNPASYEDAVALLARVTAAIDAALDASAAAGHDDLYQALRALRVTVADNIRSRGATLSHVTTFDVALPLPAPVLAQRFYRDARRADELVAACGTRCVNPLFMPTAIQALAA